MDYLHAKVAGDLLFSQPLKEDEFYQRHSCDWLQNFKCLVRRIGRAKLPNSDRAIGEAKLARS